MPYFQPAIVSSTSKLNDTAFRNDTTYIVFNRENSGIYIKSYNEVLRFGGLDVLDNLISFSKNNPLSANMGRVLNDIKINYTNIVDSLDGETLANRENVPPTITKVLSANMGKELDKKIMLVSENSIQYVDLIKDFEDPNITSVNHPLSSYLGYILFTTLNDYIESNNDRSTRIESNCNTLRRDIDTNRRDINTNTSDIRNIKSDITSIQSTYSSLRRDIDSNRRDIDTNTSDISNIKLDIDKLNDTYTGLKEGIRINRTNIDINASEIRTIKTAIGNIRLDLGRDREDIDNLLLTVSLLDNRLVEVENYIRNLLSRVSTMNNRIDDIEEYIASIKDLIRELIKENESKYDIITTLDELRNYDINNPERDKTLISAGIAYDIDQRTRVMRVNMLKHNAPARIYATMLNGPYEVVQDGNCHCTVWSWEGQAIKSNQMVHMLSDENPVKPENRRSGKFVTMLG